MKVKQYKYINDKWDKELDYSLDSHSTLIIIFGNKDKEVVPIINNFPQSKIIGCSSGGEICKDFYTLNDSLVISVIQFEKSSLTTVTVDINNYDDSFSKGKEIFSALQDENLKGIITFAPGLTINGTKFVAGLSSTKGACTICGGLAGNSDITETFIYSNKGKELDKAVAVGVYGEDVEVFSSAYSGVAPISLEREITLAKDNIVFEIDNMTAYEFYCKYLPDSLEISQDNFNSLSFQFPLSIADNLNIDEDTVRTPIGLNITNGSIIFSGEFTTGDKVRLLRATTDRFIEGANKACRNLYSEIGNRENLVIAVSCVGRRSVLRDYIDDEIVTMKNIVSHHGTLCGFYSFGEISDRTNNYSVFHNQTMNLIGIVENKDE